MGKNAPFVKVILSLSHIKKLRASQQTLTSGFKAKKDPFNIYITFPSFKLVHFVRNGSNKRLQFTRTVIHERGFSRHLFAKLIRDFLHLGSIHKPRG